MQALMRATAAAPEGSKKLESQRNHLAMEEDTPLSPSEMTPRQRSWGEEASPERARTPAVDIGMGQHSTISALQRSLASSASRNLQDNAGVWHSGHTHAPRQCHCLCCMLHAIHWLRALMWGCATAVVHCGTPLSAWH